MPKSKPVVSLPESAAVNPPEERPEEQEEEPPPAPVRSLAGLWTVLAGLAAGGVVGLIAWWIMRS